MPDYQKLWKQIKHEFLEEEIKHREQLLETHSDSDSDTQYRWEIELNILKMVLRVMDSTEKYSH